MFIRFSIAILALISSLAALAQDRAPTDRKRDPAVWGIYSRLIGAYLVAPKGQTVEFYWGQAEEIIVKNAGEISRMTPTGPGTLAWTTPTEIRQGFVQADGSVLWQMKPDAEERLRLRITDRGVIYDWTDRDGNPKPNWNTLEYVGGLPERWGALSRMAGRRYGGREPSHSIRAFEWTEPNKVLVEHVIPIGNYRGWKFVITWDERKQRLTSKGGGYDNLVYVGTVQADGSVRLNRKSWLPGTGGQYSLYSLVGDAFRNESETLPVLNEQSEAAFREQANREMLAEQRAERERSMARWDRMNAAVGAMNGALADVQEVTAANAAQAEAELQATLASRRAEEAQAGSPSPDVTTGHESSATGAPSIEALQPTHAKRELSPAGGAPGARSESAPQRAPDPSSESGATVEKSNCYLVDDYPVEAMGVAKSEEAALAQAMARTKGCQVKSQSCNGSRNVVGFKPDGNPIVDGMAWDCRVTYWCGKQRQVCESRGPVSSSKQ